MAELMARKGSSLHVLEKGQAVSGVIKKLTPQEILMDIGSKGDALVIEFDKQNLENLMSNLKIGDRVTATVISPESEGGFPVVSLRKALDDIIFRRFDDLASRDQELEVVIEETTRGGYFAVTGDGIRGFLPSSQAISGVSLEKGNKIKVKILEYDRSKKRVVFSQKATQFVTNVDSMKSLIKAGETVPAEITEVVPYGLFVKIEKKGGQKAQGPALSHIEGFVHISEISYERVENIGAKYRAGEKIQAEVIEIDPANRRVNLSIKKTLTDVFADIRKKYKAEDKVKGKVTKISSRGITLLVDAGINGLIPSDKISSGTTYEPGQEVECEVVGFDDRRRVIILSPILKVVPIGYR
jgi:4-hydroxy-3-methylbut-2-enyl diphosphate reductase